MKLIVASLTGVSTLLLVVAFGIGWSIDDPSVLAEAAQRLVSMHFLVALGGLVFAALLHAIVLTYFMGTGRWLEETCNAYGLGDQWLAESRSLKYRTVLGMVACLVPLIGTGATGAAADPASPVTFSGWTGLSSATIHFLAAATMLGVNMAVNFWEYLAVDRNGMLINEVLDRVRTIRQQRGLPV